MTHIYVYIYDIHILQICHICIYIIYNVYETSKRIRALIPGPSNIQRNGLFTGFHWFQKHNIRKMMESQSAVSQLGAEREEGTSAH